MRESIPGKGNNMCRGREPENTSPFWKHSMTEVSMDKIQKKKGAFMQWVGQWQEVRPEQQAAQDL